jgi:hypothetical protein
MKAYLSGTAENVLVECWPTPVFQEKFTWHFQVGKFKSRINQCENDEEKYSGLW